jgi:uncharacterized protein (TIGR00255 family)
MKSMTGYGNCSYRDEFYVVNVEIKSLNHRYLDMQIYANNEISHLECDVKKLLSERIKRGKVHVSIYASSKKDPALELDKEMLKEVTKLYREAYELISSGKQPNPDEIIRFEGIITRPKERIEDEELISHLFRVLETALKEYEKMAVVEGNRVRDWLMDSMQRITAELDPIEAHIPAHRNQLKERLQKAVEDLLAVPVAGETEKRLMVELALYIDKYDVNEEIVRLRDHLDKMNQVLRDDGKETGKRMNFIVQEMQREIQTLSSKFNNIIVFPSILAIKEEIEKCRELIQNVE